MEYATTCALILMLLLNMSRRAGEQAEISSK